MKLRDLALPLVAIIVVAADQASKAWVIDNVPLNGSLEVIPLLKDIFVITHITNSGAAFGMFPQLSLVFTFVALAVSVVIVFYHRSLPPGQWLVRLSLGLQLGGAVGNLIDRITANIAKIGHFHVADVPGRHEPGTGEINYKNIFRHLHRKGYQGTLCMEHGKSKRGKEGERAVIDAYRPCDSFEA